VWGFLYGWTLFLVIQTRTIAAVGFARYFGVLWAWVAEDHYLVAPVQSERWLCALALDHTARWRAADRAAYIVGATLNLQAEENDLGARG
jgi:hypothetical protein